MIALQRLHEREGLPCYELPQRLVELYGGCFGLSPGPRTYANFVSSLDGVVALGNPGAAPKLISDSSPADRFVMGLLRAAADAVLIGAGTLRPEPRHLWTPEKIYPEAAADYAEMRRRLGRSQQPLLVVLTGSGQLDPGVPALEAGALVLTTAESAGRLRRVLPSASTVITLGDTSPLDIREALKVVRQHGHEVVLSEGGPNLLGQLLAAKALDELYLTVSPLVAGRGSNPNRLGLVHGVQLLPDVRVRGRLLSLRLSDSFLFLRYDFSRQTQS